MAYRQGRTPEHQHPQQGRAQNEANQEGVEQGSKGVEKGEPRNTSLWLAVSRGDSPLGDEVPAEVFSPGDGEAALQAARDILAWAAAELR
jgi:hypothetical protein